MSSQIQGFVGRILLATSILGWGGPMTTYAASQHELRGIRARDVSRRSHSVPPAMTIDARDGYPTRSGWRSLSRELGAVVVRWEKDPPTFSRAGKGSVMSGALAGCAVVGHLPDGRMLLRASPSERERQREDVRACRSFVDSVRRSSGVESANPIFVSQETGLRLVVGTELIFRLRPGAIVGAREYFGQNWNQVRQVEGTADQFVWDTGLATAEALFEEVAARGKDADVLWVEPDYHSEARRTTGDPLYAAQWHLRNVGANGALTGADIGAETAWSFSWGLSNMVVAVIDDGVEMAHPDLRDKIFFNPGEKAGNGVDDDRNGYINDFHGWDFALGNSNSGPKDEFDYHGTPMGGIVAAATDNAEGLASLARRCQVMSVKVFNGVDFVSVSKFAEAVYYAGGRNRSGIGTWRGADVLSMSLTIDQAQVIDDALDWAAMNGRNGKGCPMFAAAGNNASRWGSARMRLPIAQFTGPGTFKIGFEYRKDSSVSDGEDLAKIDDVVFLRGDGYTQIPSPLGAQGRQDFEGAFPPDGWSLDSASGVQWRSTTEDAFLGTGGSRSARSGLIADGEWTELQTPYVTLQGDEWLSFQLYISSEFDYDGVLVWVYDLNGDIVDYYGGPDLEPWFSGHDAVVTSTGYPARHPHVLGVGAANDQDRRADYSQYGAGLEFLASSSGGWNDIPVTDRTGDDGVDFGDYVFDFGGTSSACALAASAGALLLSADPSLTAAQVREFLRAGCDRIGGVTYGADGWNPQYGYGRLNVGRSIQSIIDPAHIHIVDFQRTNSQVELTFSTRLHSNYRVEKADLLSLDSSVWSGLDGATHVVGTGGLITVSDSQSSTTSRRYYRVRLLP